jgi:hypothetical protein
MKTRSIALIATLVAVGCKGPSSQDAGAPGERGAPPAAKSGASGGEKSQAPARKAERAAAAEPTREPTPEPTPEPIVVPAGTSLVLVIESAVSSATARAEDEVKARLGEDVKAGGDVVLERDSAVRGHVVSVKRSGKVKGVAELHVVFDTIEVNGRSYDIDASPVDETAKSTKGRDAKVIGGAAGAGAIIGGIAGGGSGALKGVLIGGAAGTGGVLLTRGKEVVLDQGSRLTVKLEKGLRLR